MELKVKILRPGAGLPARATPGSAGYDLCLCAQEALLIPPGEIRSASAGIAIELPQDTVGLVFGRSGLGIKHGIVPANAVGVIDSDYRGEILVGLINHSAEAYTIQPGERMAQLVILPVLTPEIVPVQTLSESTRAQGGFGSTGK